MSCYRIPTPTRDRASSQARQETTSEHHQVLSTICSHHFTPQTWSSGIPKPSWIILWPILMKILHQDLISMSKSQQYLYIKQLLRKSNTSKKCLIFKKSCKIQRVPRTKKTWLKKKTKNHHNWTRSWLDLNHSRTTYKTFQQLQWVMIHRSSRLMTSMPTSCPKHNFKAKSLFSTWATIFLISFLTSILNKSKKCFKICRESKKRKRRRRSQASSKVQQIIKINRWPRSKKEKRRSSFKKTPQTRRCSK